MGIDIPSSLGLPFVFRGFLPGLIGWALVAYFLLPPFGLVIIGGSPEFQIALSLLASLLVGALLVTLDYSIFTFYEGRLYWPQTVSSTMIRRLQNKIDSMQKEEDEVKDERKRAELWFKLRQFPETGEGRRIAAYPTLMGNLLKQAEDYPLKRYGMDPEFFWFRLKFLIPKEKFSVLENTKAQVDFLVYTSFLFVIYAIAHFITYTVAGDSIKAVLGVIFAITLAYLLYRISLKELVIYLEDFKSIFDVYRNELRRVIDEKSMEQEERSFWGNTLERLQYGQKPEGEMHLMLKVAPDKDASVVGKALKDAGLVSDVFTGSGDCNLLCYTRISDSGDASSKVEQIKKFDGVTIVFHFLRE